MAYTRRQAPDMEALLSRDIALGGAEPNRNPLRRVSSGLKTIKVRMQYTMLRAMTGTIMSFV